MRLQALCLDLDGTLLDNGGMDAALRRTCADVASKVGGLTTDAVLAADLESWRSYWPEVEARWTVGAVSGEAVELEVWRRALQACGCDDADAVRFARERLVFHEAAAQRLFDDAAKALALLPANLPLALITNGASDLQRRKIAHLGLSERFDAVVISGEVGSAKPSLEIFAAALERLGARPEDAWHVGDNLATDVAGANDAGMTSVWINRSGLPRPDLGPRANHEVISLVELGVLLGL